MSNKKDVFSNVRWYATGVDDWRLKDDYVYCFGSKNAMKLPTRVVLLHDTRRTVYGFISLRSACKFLFSRIRSACFIEIIEEDGLFYIYVEQSHRDGRMRAILVTDVDFFDCVIDHYKCFFVDNREF